MGEKAKKIGLIMWISSLKDKNILDELLALKQKTSQKQKTVRQSGWAKDMILYVAPDFDETPKGFEDYMKPEA